MHDIPNKLGQGQDEEKENRYIHKDYKSVPYTMTEKIA
jgi:hypothetical protein